MAYCRCGAGRCFSECHWFGFLSLLMRYRKALCRASMIDDVLVVAAYASVDASLFVYGTSLQLEYYMLLRAGGRCQLCVGLALVASLKHRPCHSVHHGRSPTWKHDFREGAQQGGQR